MYADSSDYDPFELIMTLIRAGKIPIASELYETLLRRAVGNQNQEMVQILLENGGNPNLACKDGKTLLHYAVGSQNKKIVRALLENGANPNSVYEDGKTPLHYAVDLENQKIVRVLLENGANPNLACKDGLTPLHYIFKERNFYDEGLMEIFFKINEDKNQKVEVDAQDKLGNTALHLVLECAVLGIKIAVESLLRRGADPNVANAEGSTPLHLICKKRFFYDITQEDLVELFFNINDERHQTVEVDAVDKLGNTPLHLALECVGRNIKKVVEVLLRRGAGPNVANTEGSTPLHLICKKQYHWYYFANDDLAELFFKIKEEKHQAVEVDAMDNSGQTPLQLAVANVLPNAVRALVDHGADLSNFLFTTEPFETRIAMSVEIKLKVISGFLANMDHLENGGYEITRSHALNIMNLFHVYGFLENSTNPEEYWNDKEQMAIETKEIMINSSLSLYDLIQLRFEEVKKLLTYTDCYKFISSDNIFGLPEEPRKACLLHLCEKLSRGFFRCWALECFMELTHCRLPLEVCELIIDESLTNENLRNICLATTVQSS